MTSLAWLFGAVAAGAAIAFGVMWMLARRAPGNATAPSAFDAETSYGALRRAVDQLDERLSEEARLLRRQLAGVRDAVHELRAQRSVAEFNEPAPEPGPFLVSGSQEVGNTVHDKSARSSGAELVAESPDLASLAREVVALSDTNPSDLSAIRGYLEGRVGRVDCMVTRGEERDWYLIQLESGDHAVTVPATRRPMGTVPLGEMFDFSDYNGFDPIRPEHIVAFPESVRGPNGWTLLKKGHIDGGH